MGTCCIRIGLAAALSSGLAYWMTVLRPLKAACGDLGHLEAAPLLLRSSVMLRGASGTTPCGRWTEARASTSRKDSARRKPVWLAVAGTVRKLGTAAEHCQLRQLQDSDVLYLTNSGCSSCAAFSCATAYSIISRMPPINSQCAVIPMNASGPTAVLIKLYTPPSQ